ncbi:class I SAM-dependent methyltransferase [Arthrobacter bambusae]|uniref:Ubiquinone/menaquinone biosynthesis C-methylase UbiE n=1 Tax=Arthrobacter bambusae TaxID=1338426 RepID=A0AAW8DAE9_9MICC|nr:class I SAM-dependent methyltransferase [Arthrobacter bambusae]MDP9903270.1 ubiquinone/menaquinone biosynthesis C-methylase UbiE [Arthrobacter bambusae]MDQ0128736.1 ubiquinone/menaquinone biosynthesis C-methylase UbiE [Arthrobacter bambusae]MDQ0180077.1 ubiquinone/menaquinone biosynthesis C-methylase UbiE [Arthrobacter bambusae]
MTADQGYATTAAQAYLLDPLAKTPPLTKGSEFPMPDGKADTSHVIVSFAGTNPGDSVDVIADAQSVVAGKTVNRSGKWRRFRGGKCHPCVRLTILNRRLLPPGLQSRRHGVTPCCWAAARLVSVGNESIRAAYGARAAEYTRILGSVEDMHELDRQRIRRWATSIDGHLLDAGCGPGHWTNFLYQHGVTLQGIDLVSEFVESARVRFPDVPFRVGSFHDLDVPDGSLQGVLAWYSLIHLPPDELPEVLREFARALAQGGQLLVGFFDGIPGEPFQHAVTTAYYSSIEQMGHLLREAGFYVLEVETRRDQGKRAHAAVTAAVR